ncbi:MAG: hypothetical protein HY869_21035 [Chloroflexi bacterium]|nr:hypothetical protein [Chloroflexota bacterium]
MQTQFDDPIKLLRLLKGAPLAVLLAIYWTRQRVTAEWLATVTGYTDKPVTSALKLLTTYSLITKVQGGWQLSGGAQLPLMAIGSSDSENFRSTSSSLNQGSSLNISDDEEETRKNSDSFRVNYRTLKGYGIREPALSRLSALPHVTEGFIHAHVRQVYREHGHLGTAIHRIEKDWPAPEVVEEKPASSRYSSSVFFQDEEA